MKAWVRDSYGSPEVLRLEDVPDPQPGPSDVILRPEAVSLNGSDLEFLTGRPAYSRMMGLFRPSVRSLGSDIAGVVEAVGTDVTGFSPGDAVFGDLFEIYGCLAEKVRAPAVKLVRRDPDLSAEVAACLPQAGSIALQCLPDTLPAGAHVLVNGAGGGAGTLLVELAKARGLHVTAVDTGGKLQALRALGADRVEDYRQWDFAGAGELFDLIVDLFTTRGPRSVARALPKGGAYRVVGGHLGPMLGAAVAGPLARLTGRRMGILAVRQSTTQIAELADLALAGKLTPLVGARVPLSKTPAAFEAMASGTMAGKAVVLFD